MTKIILLCSLLLISGGNVFSQDISKEVVEINITSQQDSVKKNNFIVSININIKEGWHLNSNKPLDEYLTPTSVKLIDTTGFKVLSVEYPQEVLAKLPFSDSELSLYEGDVTINVKVEVDEASVGGKKKVSFEIEYQSCNNQTCLAPVQKTLSVDL
jgi:hypothetical protein